MKHLDNSSSPSPVVTFCYGKRGKVIFKRSIAILVRRDGVSHIPYDVIDPDLHVLVEADWVWHEHTGKRMRLRKLGDILLDADYEL